MSNQEQKPDWTTAPEGANLFWANPCTKYPWFKREKGILYNFESQLSFWVDMEDVKHCFNPDEFIERPTINQKLTVPVVKEKFTTEEVVCSKMEPTTWNGQGLPPVGTVCTIRLAFNIISNATITYMGDSVYCYRDNKNGMEYTGYLGDSAFAQIKTDRDHWIDAVNKALAKESCLVSDSILSAIYDAGLAKLPEQSQ